MSRLMDLVTSPSHDPTATMLYVVQSCTVLNSIIYRCRFLLTRSAASGGMAAAPSSVPQWIYPWEDQSHAQDLYRLRILANGGL